jgi:Pentapeptide repeats (8 copies)
MAIYLIHDRWTHRELAAIEAPSHTRALEWAARRGMSLADVDLAGMELRGAFLAGADLRGTGLADADLSGCYLRRADLRGADLRGARLAHAFLGSADLRGADLRDADLSRADLRGTSLVGADLRGTIFTGARLDGAVCDWRWGALPAELLRQQPGAPAGGSRLIVALAFHEDPGPWSWLKLLAGLDEVAGWALGTLAGWIRDGDNAPQLLRYLATDVTASQPSPPSDSEPAPRMRWVQAHLSF